MQKKKQHREFKSHAELITKSEDLEKLCHTLQNEDVLAIDTEFIREKTFFPVVALIQIGTRKESWLIDPLTIPSHAWGPFKKLLKNPKILKVFHAAQADQECLYTMFETLATPSFDTAIAGSLLGRGESPGLAKLTKEYLGVSLNKGHSRTDWTARPLPKQLTHYAHQDVEFLIELYEILASKLAKKHRYDWAKELSCKYESKKYFEPNVDELAKKIVRTRSTDTRGYNTLIQLLKWREKRVRDVDVPRKWIADDDLLIALANVRPKDLNHLSTFRGLNKGELKNSGEDILDAIAIANAIADRDLILMPEVDAPTDQEDRLYEYLQFSLKILADEQEISPKYLIQNEGLLHIIRNPDDSIADWVSAGVMTKGAADLIGNKLALVVRAEAGIIREGLNVVIKRVSVQD